MPLDWATQFRFSVEFVTFLVAVSAAAIMLLRPQLVGATARSRPAAVAGFTLLAAAAFLHGSLVVEAPHLVLFAIRALGIVVLAAATLGLGQDRRTRVVLWLALVLLGSAEVATAGDAPIAAGWLGLAGALGLGAVLVISARRSIPARVAISSAATLLVVVLAVSVALSVVIADNVERQALRRVEGRAHAEAGQVNSSVVRDALNSAKLAALSLQGNFSAETLRALAANPRPDSAVQLSLELLATNRLVSQGPLLYVTTGGSVLARYPLDPGGVALATGLATSRPVAEVLEGRTAAAGWLEVAGDRVLAVGVHKVAPPTPEGSAVAGAVVATEPLDVGYLSVRAINDPAVGLALVGRDSVLAAYTPVGGEVPDAVLEVARAALRSSSGQESRVVDDRFVAATAVAAPDGTRVFAVVGSEPTTVVADIRNSLFQVLFVVALATALAGVLVAVFVGERIGTGLRRLTTAAGRIKTGDLSVRARVSSVDELGVLGDTFDSMASSIEVQAAELRRVAGEEARLRARFETVVSGMGEALVAVDAEGAVMILNPAAEELFGIPAARALGRRVEELGEIVAETHPVDGRRELPPADVRHSSVVVIRHDGVRIPVALSAAPLTDASGTPLGGVYVLRDMRREREVERMKTEFLANISHELRTPLVPIRGFAELLRSGRVAEDQVEEFLDRILDSASDLERVVDLLVSVAADEAARLTLRHEEVAVGEMIDSLLERWQARSDGSHTLARRVARRLPPLVGDRHLLERSLDELISNALKYSPDGGRVHVSVDASRDGPAPTLTFSVRDHGVGIAPDQLERIFRDFSQADGSATREYGGLGLGLAFVRRVVRAHQGDLVCTSEPGKGSTFSIVLPAAVAGGRSRPAVVR